MRLLSRLFRTWQDSSTRSPARPACLSLESLETRLTPYAATGNLWPHPELVTISFQPDGTNLGGVASNLFATFNARFGSAAAWQNQILRAAQTWAQVTDINFTVVADNGSASGTGAYQQGDPGAGDIRIGGFNFNNPSALAMAYLPPAVNNYSVAGDISFNTAQVFNINGQAYDLYSVALHEIGHTLGLGHSAISSAVMYAVYNGSDAGLSADDIAGIRSVYTAGLGRSQDSYDATASNDTLANATNISGLLAGSLTARIDADVTTTSDQDFYRFVAPAGGNGQLTVKVQSDDLSLLAPNLRIYNSSQSLIANVSGNGYGGSTLTRTISIVPGQTYYVRVAGASTTAFGTGAYGMTLNFGSGASPSITSPNTQTLNGNPISGGGGIAQTVPNNGNGQHSENERSEVLHVDSNWSVREKKEKEDKQDKTKDNTGLSNLVVQTSNVLNQFTALRDTSASSSSSNVQAVNQQLLDLVFLNSGEDKRLSDLLARADEQAQSGFTGTDYWLAQLQLWTEVARTL